MSPPKRLDEPSLRRPDFREGPRIRLADGQGWTFPKPRLRFTPIRDDGGGIGLKGGWTHDDAYAAMRDALLEVDPDDTFELIRMGMQVVCYLLLANYGLSDADLARLLPIEFDDPANKEMWGDLQHIIYADPKGPSPSGSGPA